MQTKLDMFLNKKKGNLNPAQVKKNHETYHESSREHSQTEVLEPINDIHVEEINKTVELCKVMILPGPADNAYFPLVLQKLHKLKDNYNPTNRAVLYQYLEDNLKYEKFENVDILKRLDDNIFWKTTVPKMIVALINKAELASSCIRTLVLTDRTTSIVTRQQALVILIAMFFGVMPRNPFCRTRSFGQFMTKRSGQRNQELKFQKLKFIVNYFNIAVEKMNDRDFINETITFQKSISNTYELRKSLDTENYQRNVPMYDVEFCQDPNAKIEDYYGKAAMVDFANQRIGGGVLRSGSVQEEILFLIFPETIVSMMISPQMADNEAIIMYGLKRYSNYQNYSYNLKYDGPYKHHRQLETVNQSVMIAIDAINFSSKINSQVQYNRENTLRQIVKAMTGFCGIDFAAGSDMKICTGRWGCGAFSGDQIWKFFIQWIACSQAGRSMVYVSDQSKIAKELQSAVKRLINKHITTIEMLALMQNYIEIKQRSITPKQHTFIDFLKAQLI